MALTQDRSTLRRNGQGLRPPVAAGVRLFAGGIVGVNATGQAVPAGTPAAVAILGIAQENVDNRDGTAGEQSVEVRRGTFQLKPAAAGITLADYGKPVTAVDDESVGLIGEDAAIVAGIVRDVDADGVWVEF